MKATQAKELKLRLEQISGLPCFLLSDPNGGKIIQLQTKPDQRYPAWTLYSPEQVLKAMENFART